MKAEPATVPLTDEERVVADRIAERLFFDTSYRREIRGAIEALQYAAQWAVARRAIYGMDALADAPDCALHNTYAT